MKLNVGVVFGGKSVEHEISIISAVEAMGYMNENKYNIIPIYIDKNNDWYTGEHLKDIMSYRDIALVKRYAKKVSLVKNGKCFYLQTMGFLKINIALIDVILPIGHGTFLEDGSLQGYLEMIGIPYLGSGVLASSIGNDKVIFKELLKSNNIPVPNYVWFYDHEFNENKNLILDKIKTLKYPVIVKPATLGSSIGITNVLKEEDLIKAIKEAIKFDKKIIVEEKIKNLTDVNVSILGNSKHCISSSIEEINTSEEFFSFKEKYVSGYNKLIKKEKKSKPVLSKEMIEDIKNYAKDVFHLIDASGVSRIDFLIDSKNNLIYVSEINTMPGSLSSYLWLEGNKSQTELIDDLFEINMEEYKEKKEKILSFSGNLLEDYDILDGKKFKTKNN